MSRCLDTQEFSLMQQCGIIHILHALLNHSLCKIIYALVFALIEFVSRQHWGQIWLLILDWEDARLLLMYFCVATNLKHTVFRYNVVGLYNTHIWCMYICFIKKYLSKGWMRSLKSPSMTFVLFIYIAIEIDRYI